MSAMLEEAELKFDKLTSHLSEKEFAFVKIQCWVRILNNGLYPEQWCKPTAKGTKVVCRPIENRDDYELKYGEFKNFIEWANKKYDLGLEVKRKPKEVTENVSQSQR